MNSISPKVAALGAALFASALAVATAGANPLGQPQVASLTGGAASPAVTLPEVMIGPTPRSAWFYDPYTSGRSSKASSLNRIPAWRYRVPPGYDAVVAMHPYTSGFGPCTEAPAPAQGCHHPTGNPIPPSHYDRAPFNQ